MNKKALVIMLILGGVYFYLTSWVTWQPEDGFFEVRMPRGVEERIFRFEGPHGEDKIALGYSSDGSCGYYAGKKKITEEAEENNTDKDWLSVASRGFIKEMESGKVVSVEDTTVSGFAGKSFKGTAYSKRARREFQVKGRLFLKGDTLYVQFTIGEEDEEFFNSFKLIERSEVKSQGE